ncbi:hypothetical protein L218DRAFT_1078353 [Marasmius fiardii PR-910]|nr:hypothetical protein L218DRAFT_1078353 [Marasmius fiardii PR-910]
MVIQDQDGPVQPATGDLAHPFDTVSGRVIITLFYSIAIVLTLYRVFHRVRIHRFSWDDWLACLALLLIILYLILDWVRITIIDHRQSYDPEKYSDYLIAIYLIANSFSVAILWCSRASLSLSITRILPPSRLRKFTIFFSVICLLAGVIVIVVNGAICTWTRITGVPGPGLPRCAGGPILYIFTAACDLTTSLILTALPLHFLWRNTVDLPKSERRLILTLFASSFLTFIACLVHIIYIAEKNPFAITYSSKMQASVSLIVCNLVVVVPSLYTLLFRRYFNGNRDSATYTEGTPSVTPYGTITTVTHPFSTTNQGTTTRTQSSKSKNNSECNFELTRITDVDDESSSCPELTTHTHISVLESARVDGSDHDSGTLPKGVGGVAGS